MGREEVIFHLKNFWREEDINKFVATQQKGERLIRFATRKIFDRQHGPIIPEKILEDYLIRAIGPGSILSEGCYSVFDGDILVAERENCDIPDKEWEKAWRRGVMEAIGYMDSAISLSRDIDIRRGD